MCFCIGKININITNLFSLYIFPPKIVKLVSGYDAYKLVLKEQIPMAECIIQLDNNGNRVF